MKSKYIIMALGLLLALGSSVLGIAALIIGLAIFVYAWRFMKA